MSDSADPSNFTEAAYIDALCDADLQALHKYWESLRSGRQMPRRADIDPSAIPKLLPFVVMYTVAPDGSGYTMRLIGEEIVRFTGRNSTGKPAGSIMTPRSAAMMTRILDTVAAEKTPKFRAGKAHWHADKAYRDFEACFLPLSADGETVDIILAGVKFPTSVVVG